MWKQLNGYLLTAKMNGQAGGDKEHWSVSQILVLVTPANDQLYHLNITNKELNLPDIKSH